MQEMGPRAALAEQSDFNVLLQRFLTSLGFRLEGDRSCSFLYFSYISATARRAML